MVRASFKRTKNHILNFRYISCLPSRTFFMYTYTQCSSITQLPFLLQHFPLSTPRRTRIGDLLTPWCRVLLEKLTGLQLAKKFPAFHGTRRFITALTSVRHLSLSWASPIQSIYPHPTSWLPSVRQVSIQTTPILRHTPYSVSNNTYSHTKVIYINHI